jgi:hypothetical protein
MPGVDRISPETLEKITAYAHAGGRVIAIGRIPAHAPGLKDFASKSLQVQAAAKTLFAANGTAVVQNAADLPPALHATVAPQFELTPANPAVGMIRRVLPDGEVFFIANTSNQPVTAVMKLRTNYASGEWLDADSGAASPLADPPSSIKLNLPPYASRILLMHSGAASPVSAPHASDAELADLSSGWSVSFPGSSGPSTLDRLTSWTDSPETEFFSGVAVYRREFSLPSAPSAAHVLLDFGQGTSLPEEQGPVGHPGMRALYDPPIREAAVVFVNGSRAGSLWHPPYQLDITPLIHAGSNTLEVRVANTAINEMAGQSQPDYRLLWTRYGKRFAPQDMDHLEPIPSGMLGPIKLIQRSAH